MKKQKFKTAQEYYKEAHRYYKNAKGRLKESHVEYDRYQDLKPVREACGTCYLAVLLALDGYFLERGVQADKLPTSTDGYQEFLRKYAVHNGKIKNAYYNVYENLHILGYYRGAGDINTVKSGFEKAKLIIDTLVTYQRNLDILSKDIKNLKIKVKNYNLKFTMGKTGYGFGSFNF